LRARSLTLASDTTTGGDLRHDQRRRPGGSYRDVLVPVAVTVLAALMRLPTLAQQSFWLDEGYTERLVRMSLGGMLHAIPRTESTPPVYYAAAWMWTRLFGDTEFGLRSLSALAGIVTIPVAWAVARRLAGTRAGAIAGLLLAVSPLMVWFSQEARAYALATLLATITLLCVVAWLRERRDRWLIGWALAAALGLATHYFVVFIVAPELVLMWHQARRSRSLTAASALVLAVGAALVPLALAQRGTGHADYIAQGSLGTRVLQVPKQLLLGYASPSQLLTSIVAAVLILAGALWPLIASPADRRRARVPLIVGLVCVVVPVVLAVVGIDFLDTRNLLPALPPLYVSAAIGFAAFRRWPLGGVLAAGVAVISALAVVLVDANARYQRDDWRGAATALGAAAAPRAIVVTPASGLIPLQAYVPGLRTLTRPAAVRELDVIAIGPQTVGAGIGAPPRPAAPLPVPPGFRLVRAVRAQTYTVLRYRSARPVPVSAVSLAGVRLGTGVPLALIAPAGQA
jgi:mannosyltransferase